MLKSTGSSIVIYSGHISCSLHHASLHWISVWELLQHSSKKAHITTDQPHQLQAPEYEDINAQQVARAVKCLDQPFELKENVAYGPSKIHDK